jgi:hypothetical protein
MFRIFANVKPRRARGGAAGEISVYENHLWATERGPLAVFIYSSFGTHRDKRGRLPARAFLCGHSKLFTSDAIVRMAGAAPVLT